MNDTLIRATLIGVPVSIGLLIAIIALIRTRTMTAALGTVGAAGLAVVVFTHVAEAWQWFPAIGWGQPNSVGHYIDVTGATVGVVCLLGAALVRSLRRY